MKRKLDKSQFGPSKNIGGKDDPCCDEPNVVPRHGSMVCLNCGTVAGKDFVLKEKRAFTAAEVSKRKRTEIRWQDIGPRTYVGNYKDSNGRNLSPREKMRYRRLGKIQKSLTISSGS